MFQKELGEKILGKFPSANYGRLSILTDYRLHILKKFLVSPNCFLPKPKVTSLVIHFKPQLSTIILKDISNLEKITNIIFSNKRKMINKNIKKVLSKKDISLINNLKLNLRPAEIEPEIFYNIAKLYEKR
jgi:16S rRNA (adenine1518-N6/adenine1519-N6)-dimethyltransferase